MNRYRKNINVIGEEGQQRLSSSSVFVVGCGALGGHVSMLLAGAGVGKIGIADFDTIDISNLQRQLFFDESAVGESKSHNLDLRLRSLNSEIEIAEYNQMINRKNANEILKNYDMIVDATDNPSTKYFIDETARNLHTPCCIGGVAGWRGQVILFPNTPEGDGISYNEIFPSQAEDSGMLPCEMEGVMGPAASVIASIQASEIIQYLSMIPNDRFAQRMIAVDLLTPSMDVIKF